tara:strand:- start:677 stop:1183 length:507 start_codon:yes stop_codon:yes gene_type:complete
MLVKLKENIAFVAVALGLMGSVGAGLTTAADIVNTLQGIDDRMNNIEYEFQTLKDSTMVSNDIAVLYEKIYALEQTAQQAEYYESQYAYLQAEINNLNNNLATLKYDTEQALRDANWDLDQKYVPEIWEWNDLGDKIIRLETQIQNIQNDLWELDVLDDRLTWLESNQ